MCTLVLAARVVREYPLLVVANRDEQKARPSTPPRRWEMPGKVGFWAPRDEVAGGTWLGWNDAGVFVGITNRFLGPRDASRRSRGAIVADALGETSARGIHGLMARLDPADYNGFHLIYADGSDVLATVADGRTLTQLTLGDGLSIVTERSFGAGNDAQRVRVERIRQAWSRILPSRTAEPLTSRTDFDLARATTLLTDHDATEPLGATCIHLEQLDYGTRSAMVLGVPASGGRTESQKATLLWAEGPPCTTPFVAIDMTSK